MKIGSCDKDIKPKVVSDIHFNECASNVKALMFPFYDYILL